MASAEERIEKAVSILNIRREAREILLKKEQEQAIKHLLNEKDVLAILPTGFGKSLTFTIFALAREEMLSKNVSVLIVSPLKSIIDDQLSEMLSLNFIALELSAESTALLLSRKGAREVLLRSLGRQE